MKILVAILASATGTAAILAAASVLVLGKYDTAGSAAYRGGDTFVLGLATPARAVEPDAAATTCSLPLP